MTDPADRIARLSPAKRALLALEVQSKRQTERPETPKAEPIALVGLSCRFPGGAGDPESFWRLLRNGVDAVGEVPAGRWDLDTLYDPDPNIPGKIYTRAGGFLSGVDAFDAQFFGIPPGEAEALDPQHRLLLEVAWEALERAGRSADELVGSPTGVFVGISSADYSQLQMGDLSRINAYTGTGNALSAAAGRLSYLLGLQGPCLAVDTACSSSLVAIHLACQSLRTGECNLALAGGVNLVLSPDSSVYSCRIRVLSPDGRCKSFDATANGYIRGEGCGLVVLKRLSEAVAAGDPILAVIRGSAINQDGRSAGLTAPNGQAQRAVLRQALENAGLQPAQVGYVEAHGSATPLGDPIEVQALAAVLGEGRPPGEPLRIGSVKSNLGHLESAAGVAGLIKTVLALQHREIPPSLHFRTPNPNIPFDRLPVVVQDRLTPWPEGQRPARAGVSSFGFVGTNAHAVLEEAPAAESSGPSRPWQLLPLSARTASALETATRNLADPLRGGSDLADAAYTLKVGRKLFGHRRVALCSGPEDAVTVLESLDPQRVFTHTDELVDRSVAFLFPGLGDHYPRMAAELYESEPAFREVLDCCAELLRPLCGEDIREVLFPAAPQAGEGGFDLRAMLGRGTASSSEAERLQKTKLAQPAVFAIEYALARLLMDWGVRPQAMIGYSLGEFVAACLAEVFSLEDALKLVARRAELIEGLSPGAMLAVPLPEDEMRGLLGSDLSLAAVNGPALCVVSGPPEAVEQLERGLVAREVICRRLQNTHAFHSRMMEPLAEPLAELMRTVELQAPRIPYLSNVTGTWITSEQATDPAYWTRHLCRTVRFVDGIGELLQDPDRALLEVGPGQSLGSFARQHPACGAARVVLPTLRYAYDRQPDLRFLLATLGRLWLAGVRIDWTGFYSRERRRRVVLPTYPFERQRYWLQAPPVRPSRLPVLEPEAPRKKSDAADWFYIPAWQPAVPLAPAALDEEAWLIFADDLGLGEALAERLRREGRTAVEVHPGASFACLAEDRYALRPGVPEDYAALMAELRAEERMPRRIVHAWSVTAGRLAGEEVQQRGFYSLLFLAQSLGDLGAAEPVRLAVISDGLQAVTGTEETEPEKALLLGPCTVLPQELPRLVCCSLDIGSPGPMDGDELVDALIAEVVAGRDPVVAYRGGARWVRAFEPVRLEAAEAGAARLRDQGVYLVTGGFGGLGLAVAQLLARRVRARLVLVGRTALPEREAWDEWLASHPEGDPVSARIHAVRALETEGAEVLAIAADVADPERMREVVDLAVARFGGLHGVIHAAGVPGAGLAQLKTREAAAAVLRPKVQGSLALLEALGDRPLDALVLFSSLTAVTGGFGQMDYCAANAFLDALARRRSAAGQPTVSIGWGLWQWDAWEDGAGSPASLRERHREMRNRVGLTSAEGLDAMLRALGSGLSHVVVSPVELSGMIDELNRLTAEVVLAEARDARRQQSLQARPALGVTYVPASNRIERTIAEVWQRTLGLRQVGLEDNFFDLGGNSLLGLQVVSDINRELGARLTPVALFASPTVGALARALAPQEPVATLAKPRRDPAAAPAKRSNEIALVGMAFRFPQAADARQLWNLLAEGREALTSFSDEELLAAGVPPERIAHPGYVKVGSVLDGYDTFDAGLFGYTPREAEILDPQQRLFLECAWEALEHAGYDSQRFPGKVGVFAGANLSTYFLQLMANPRIQGSVSPLQMALANEKDSLTTNVSYKLNLRGPSVAVQTFCSTSLVAVHIACRSLVDGDSDLTLAGGVRVAVPHRVGYIYEEGGIEPPDGRCRAFDAKGKGAILGNGVGLVVLKRLDDALADGDTIHAVIKGSAINNDGSLKVGYTAPSIEGQAQAVATALEAAGVDPGSIGYVEAHGTGTALGDPVEIAALARAYRRDPAAGRCPIGSVKTNFGHLDRAAGISGLIKAVLALQRGMIPPSLYFEEPNPNIDFESSPFYVNTQLSEWPAGSGPRRAGVNSVGMGGTNVHLVLEQAPAAPPAAASRPWQLLLLSARTSTALDVATARLAEHLEREPDLDLADAAFTLQVGRRVLSHRRMLVCASAAEAVAALRDASSARVLTAWQEPARRPVVFLFPGLGDQYVGMAAGLYQREPSFRDTVDRCAELLRPHLGMDLREVLYPAAEEAAHPAGLDLRRMLRRGGEGDAARRLSETWITQPAVFVVEYALAILLMEWGVRPQAMVGYSLGEYVAACLAGVLSLEDALTLVARRARMIHELPAGAMLAVALPEEEVAPLLFLDSGLSLAAVNGPSLSVVAGPVAEVEALERRLAERGVAASRLQTSHAFHSRMIDPLAGSLTELARGFELRPPRIPFLSNVTGTWMTAEEATDPGYWARHMCGTVRFASALAELLREPERIIVEVGPGQSLAAVARQHPGWDGDPRRLAISTLRYEYNREPDLAFLLTALGRLWMAGVEVDWDGFYARESRRRVPLPAYPFDRQRYWIEAAAAPDVALTAAPSGKRPDIADWFYVPVWKPSILPVQVIADVPEPPADWLMFVDEQGLGRLVADKLREYGQAVTCVTAGPRFRRVDDGEYVLDPRRQEDYETLLETLGEAPGRVVHLWSLDPVGMETEAERLVATLDLGFYSLLALAKAVGRQGITVAIDLWVVSDQAQKVTGAEDLHPEAATVLGPCRVIPQEYLNITCRSLDVRVPSPGSRHEARLVHQIAAELALARDLTVAYRGNDRWVQTFEPLRLEEPGGRRTSLRQRGVYLITGGLGNIGMALAEHLASRVRARVALLGRAAFPEREGWDEWLAKHPESDGVSRKIRRLRAIEAKGAEVLVVRADVADEAAVASALKAVRARFGALHGVIHAAGVTAEETFVPVQQVERRHCELHFRPKIGGLIALEKALRGESLDFCLLQSSLSSVLGGLGFAAYVAANTFMDAFAHLQNQESATPWISVDWDTWPRGDEGTSSFGATVAQFAMTWPEGLEAFERVVALGGGIQLVHSTGDLGARLAQWVELRSARAPEGTGGAVHARPQLANPYVPPHTDVERRVAVIWQDVLGIDQVGRGDNFFELGGHSLLATQVFSRLRQAFRVELPLRSLFEGPTVAELSCLIEGALWAGPAAGTAEPPIRPIPRDGDLPLSFAQQRLWFSDRLRPGNPLFNEPMGMHCTGRLDVAALQGAFSEIVRRHEVLRTTYGHRRGQPFQMIAPPLPVVMPVIDLAALPEGPRETELARLSREEAERPFDLSRGPVLRLHVARLGDEQWRLLFVAHHIVHDGWTGGVLQREIQTLYEAFVSRRPSPLPELRVQYADFAHWQRQWLQGEALERQLHYWTERLDGVPTLLRWASDRPRPVEQSFRGARRAVSLPEELRRGLQTAAQREGATLFMILLTAFGVLLHLYTEQDDLLVASPIANRNRIEVEGLIGLLANLLALRLDFTGDPEFGEMVRRTREATLGAYTHQDLPFDFLVEKLQPERDASHGPLVQAHFSLESEPLAGWAAAGIQMAPAPFDNGTSQFELDLNLVETSSGLTGELLYSVDLFDMGSIDRMVERFKAVLRAVVAQPEVRLSEVRAAFDEMENKERLSIARNLGDSSRERLKKFARREQVVHGAVEAGVNEA